MTPTPNSNPIEYSPWNPFISTKRDISRTEELAKKSPLAAGLLTFLFVPLGMIYLNRGVNSLKILGYIFVFAFMLGIASYKENNAEEMEGMSNAVGFCGQVAIITENVRAVNLARKRLGLKQ
jgi:hypothetical protein